MILLHSLICASFLADGPAGRLDRVDGEGVER